MAERLRILCRLRAFVGAVPRASVRRQARRFLHATLDCRSTQRGILDELLALNAGSRFSREHRLDEVQTVATVRMSLEHAKLMAILFKRAVKGIEDTFGIVISLPPGLLEEKGISLETDW